ncbi:MAG: LysM peptidoglycan-binding domain-containing protein [Chloroflexi bacterium]|nr:LysM peptidoglycan-binding domain-containing protein [Chloroflexota bacterium]
MTSNRLTPRDTGAVAIPFDMASQREVALPRITFRPEPRHVMHGLVFTMALTVIAASRLSSQAPQLPPIPDATSIAASASVNPANAIVARVLTTTQVTAVKPSPDAGGGIIAQAALSIAGFDRSAFNLGLPVTLPAPAVPAAAPPLKPAPKIQDYEVQDGDNPYALAGSFGISEETLLAANSMDADSVLQVGEHVLIPPVTGVMVTTQPGDTVSAIADQWKIDPAKLISANQLPGDAQALIAGEPLVIPDAQPAVSIYPDTNVTLAPSPAAAAKPLLKTASPAAATAARKVTVPEPPPITKPAVAAPSHSINWFPYGQCTWWAANQRPDIGTRVVGNAAAWAYSARAAGLATGVVPRVGAVVVYQPGAQGAGWVGHVAYVTSVSGNSFTISEMNFNGWGRVDTRTSWTGPGVSFIY